MLNPFFLHVVTLTETFMRCFWTMIKGSSSENGTNFGHQEEFIPHCNNTDLSIWCLQEFYFWRFVAICSLSSQATNTTVEVWLERVWTIRILGHPDLHGVFVNTSIILIEGLKTSATSAGRDIQYFKEVRHRTMLIEIPCEGHAFGFAIFDIGTFECLYGRVWPVWIHKGVLGSFEGLIRISQVHVREMSSRF